MHLAAAMHEMRMYNRHVGIRSHFTDHHVFAGWLNDPLKSWNILYMSCLMVNYRSASSIPQPFKGSLPQICKLSPCLQLLSHCSTSEASCVDESFLASFMRPSAMACCDLEGLPSSTSALKAQVNLVACNDVVAAVDCQSTVSGTWPDAHARR